MAGLEGSLTGAGGAHAGSSVRLYGDYDAANRRDKRLWKDNGAMSTTADPIVRDPDLVEGQAAFAGTRVPVWVLFNYLTASDALDPFLRAHPGVTREAALVVLDRACRAVTGQSTQGDETLAVRNLVGSGKTIGTT
jgi:uncharacterized protein (DUF433 family)